MRTNTYKANLELIAEGYEDAKSEEFYSSLMLFISKTRKETGAVTEDDIQGFIDSFDFPDEFEWCEDELESQRDAFEDAKYEEYKDRKMGL